MRTNQELFDQVARHLLTQNCCSYRPGNHECAYRGQDDTKCAAGCLIPDNRYEDSLEGHVVTDRVVAEAIGLDTKEQIQLVRALQKIHDFDEVDQWAVELESLATLEGLNIKVLEEFQ